jgi:hypothetical protein
MTYTYASNKSDKDLVSYQSVRGAETKAIFQTIQEGTSVSGIKENFVKPTQDASDRNVADTLQFLEATDFIEHPSERTVQPIENQPFEGLPFELRLLHHLSQQETPQDHFIRITEVIANADVVLYDEEDLLEDVKRELGSYPFDWTIQKIKMWYDMMAPVGVVSVRDKEEILTSPSPAVVYDLLDAYEAHEGDQRLRHALEWVEDNFFSCYTSRSGVPTVHRGLSDTMGTLVADGVLELRSPSDATNEVDLPSAKADRVSSFTLNDRPAQPAYQYPLEAHEIEVKA